MRTLFKKYRKWIIGGLIFTFFEWLFFAILIWYLSRDLPSLEMIEMYQPPLPTEVYDINGDLIYKFYTEHRIKIGYADIPKHVREVFINLEDRNFWKHWGIDLRGVIRALIKNLLAGRIVQGGSTITQQLARNMFLTFKKSIWRKLKEAILAVKIELAFSKEEILEHYLNQIYFGSGLYGIEAASRYIFGKSVRDLSLAEAAVLAGIPKSPLLYSPVYNYKNAILRQRAILKLLYKNHVITKEEYERSLKEPIVVKYFEIEKQSRNIAPYFIEEVRKYVIAKYGEDFLYRGGGKIYTTLDPRAQRIANEVCEKWLRSLERSYRFRYRIDNYNPRDSQPPKYIQVAFVAIDPHTGYIKAMVGGRNFRHSQFNRVTQAKRQPGSAFKIFVYTAAFESGYNPGDVLPDEPIMISDDGSGKPWYPKNWDGNFLGPMPLRRGLALSRNLVAVRLIQRIGAYKVVDMAKRMGIKEEIPPYLSIALGSPAVTPLEMAYAFATIANYGKRPKPIFILKIVDHEGNILEENKPEFVRVTDSVTAYLTLHCLKSVVDNGTGIWARTRFNFYHPAAGKTGTTDDYTDAWFIGFTPYILAAVWVGYDQPRRIFYEATGAVVALPIWAMFMKRYHENLPPKDFKMPYGITIRKICDETGLLATEYCPKVSYELFRAGKEPKEYCTKHKLHYFKTKLEEF